jgi:inward rectifier potassium channel
MRKTTRKEVVRNGAYDVHILHAPRPGLRDLYHAMLRVPWWGALLIIIGGYLGLNAVFAALYQIIGGVANTRPGSYVDDFFFSVQTMGTIGYGNMYPTTTAANVLVVMESVIGLVVTALATGLVFVRFSQVRPRVRFSAKAAVGRMDGVPTLMIRVGNERRSSIVDTHFRVTLMRTTHTSEGVVVYRSFELPLVKERAPALSRAWMIMHRIVEGTPMHGDSMDSLTADEVELVVELVGTDDTSLQQVHASFRYFASSIAWNARLADIVSDTPDGNMQVDLSKFHDVVSDSAVA